MAKESQIGGRDRPSGREAVMDAVLDAATALIADRGPNAVTVRAIAQQAGVNHALVHRYFGSKEELIGAVIAREVARFQALAEVDGDKGQTTERMLQALGERRTYVRFLARAILDGYRPGPLRADSLLFGRILAALGPADGTGDDAGTELRVLVAGLGSMALGWRIFGDFLAAGLGLDEMPGDELDVRIDGFITSIMLAHTLGPARGKGGS